MTRRSRPPRRRPVAPATSWWRRRLGWIAVGFVALLGLLGGPGGALVCGGAAAAAYGLLRLVRGTTSSPGNRSAVVTIALGIAVALVGGAVPDTGGSPPAADRPAVDAPSRTSTSASVPVSRPLTPPATPSAAPTAAPAPVPRGRAAAALVALATKGRAPETGYSRDRFGSGWARSEGCDTRDQVLRRDLVRVVVQRGTGGCPVLRGTLVSPYTGHAVTMVRGPQDQVEIDHVVALSDAWQKGAQRWSEAERASFANDPLNLLAVDGASNAAKSDGDAATWLPPAKAYRCRYVARQVSVKRRYGLWVTAAERDAILRVLRTCPTQALVSAAAARVDRPRSVTEVAPSRRATSAPSRSPASPHSATDPRYATCRDANAAGRGPYVRGRDPEYAWYRDADDDGVVCER